MLFESYLFAELTGDRAWLARNLQGAGQMGLNRKSGGSLGNPPWSKTRIEWHPIEAAEHAFARGQTAQFGWPGRTVQPADATESYRHETPLLLILIVAALALAQIALGPTTAQLCERMADVTFGP